MTETNPPADDRMIHAPWSSEQVDALNAFQERGGMHPFTCGALHASGISPALDATHSGWICPDPACEYTQDWAWRSMAAAGQQLAATVTASAPTDRVALRQQIAEALAGHAGSKAFLADGHEWEHARSAWYAHADAVLAVLPDPAAIRAAALNEGADAIDAETRQAKTDGVLEPDKFRPCRDASAQLRALAGCQECEWGVEHTEHCPYPESHNWGCGCPTDQSAVSRPACSDPIECSHEAALGQAEAATEQHRLALSQALGLGAGAPWDAIRDRAAELAAVPPLTVDTSEDRCAECGHFRGAHEEAEEPVSVGRCTVCADDDEWHDFDPTAELPGPEVVAYSNSDRPGVLLCREHGDGWWGLTPLTSDDLPDGGICTFGDPAAPNDRCGRDVLIATGETEA